MKRGGGGGGDRTCRYTGAGNILGLAPEGGRPDPGGRGP
jgi:hypothetical protein